MELKINLEYEQLLKMILQLPSSQLERLRSELNNTITFDRISYNSKSYYLNTPISCSIELIEDGYIIESKILGIVGSGTSIEKAEKDFFQEFDYLYNKLQSLENPQLSKRLNKAKAFLDLIIQSIKQS